MSRLLPDDELERSFVVANCRMNRERELTGTNGYDRELRLHPLGVLRERLETRDRARWLDLCCGTGRALIQAATIANDEGLPDRLEIIGVDLVSMFWTAPLPSCLQLVSASIHHWEPVGRFDLVTCVHGLHYLGDKLKVIAKAASWLVEDGLFVANLDLANVRGEDGKPLARSVASLFRKWEIDYRPRQHLLTCRRRKELVFPVTYLGSDDEVGPNYTGQPAVSSYYRMNRV